VRYKLKTIGKLSEKLRIVGNTLFTISIIETTSAAALKKLMAITRLDAVVVVFSVVDRSSFSCLSLYSELTPRLGKTPLMLVGSKSDLKQPKKSSSNVSAADVCDFADCWGCEGLERFIPRDKEQAEDSRTIAMVSLASAKDVASTNAVFDKVCQCCVSPVPEWHSVAGELPPSEEEGSCAVQ